MKKVNSSVLFKPFSVGNVKIKNRLVVSPMASIYCDKEGMSTERFIDYHVTKAKGGWGMIIIEDVTIDPSGGGFGTAGLYKDEQIQSHMKLTEKVHNAGAKIVAQLSHKGRQTSSAAIGMQPLAPSALPCPYVGEIPREMSAAEIKYIVGKFGDAALRAKKAGFDGVEVHGAHGYLVAQFMSKYSNKRCDAYGGSLGNRLRFALEIIEDIREKCGPDFLLSFRYSGDEKVTGGRAIEETKAIAIHLEKHGVDMLHISAGTYESMWSIIPPMNVPTGWIVNDAAEVKKVVGIPVMTVGRINDPVMVESILLSGQADLIAMGRASLADPEFPNKMARGEYEDIRQCIGCQQGCVERLFKGEPIRCLVNPTCGFEYLKELKQADKPKKVTVVGAGPAGLEAARAAALAGHKVTLYEKSGRFGGQFATAAVPPGKGDISSYLAWAGRQVEKLAVNIKLNTEYTAAVCSEENPDLVIVATGAIPSKPPIPGIDGAAVVTAEDVLSGRVLTKKKVVIAGGGMVGCETATYLSTLGREVTIVEMLPNIAGDEEYTRRVLLMKDIEEQRIKVFTDAKIIGIDEKCVMIEKNKEAINIEADTVVVALGMRSNNALIKDLEGKVILSVVGDAAKARNALEATREGFMAGARA